MYLNTKVGLTELRPEEPLNESLQPLIQSPRVEPNFKLPPILLTPFSGKLEDWLAFKELFHWLIDVNSNVPSDQKFYYLKSYLSSEPLKLIQHLSATIENYNTAWKILESQYDNKRAILNAHLKSLFTTPVISNDTSTSILQVITIINESMAAIKNLGVDTSSWDSIIIYLISSKMEFETRRCWEEHINGIKHLLGLDELLKFLEIRHTILETIKTDRKFVLTKKSQSSSKTMFNQRTDTTPPTCPICSLTHRAYKCATFAQLAVTDRIKLVKEKKLCDKCLNPHKSETCKPKYRCRYCDGPHSSMLYSDQTLINRLELE